MIKYLIFDRGDTIIKDLPESFGGMKDWPYYETVDGVFETLSGLSKKYDCLIASNTLVSSAQVIHTALEKLGINDNFKYVLTQNELKCAKPSTSFFLKLIEFLNSSADEICYIGNDYELDIISAKKVGMNTILLSENLGYFPSADFVVLKFNEILRIVELLKEGI